MEELEDRVMLSLLGQQLYPSDYPWNQNISTAPVASNSATIIAHIGNSVRLTPDWGADNPASPGPLYGIPVNVVHGNSTAKVNVIIDNYPDQSDIQPVPIPANAVIEGDNQNGPNPNGAGYGTGQRGDSHLIVWDEDNNVAYELYLTNRPTDPGAGGNWHAAQETVWNMNTDQFRTLGWTSADAAGLSVLAGLARPDEGLPISEGGQGAITHALRFTLPSGDVNPQYIYPGSHRVTVSQGSNNLPLGSRLRLASTPAINTLISNMPPESQIIAHAMQQYGLILADIGSAMYVSGSSASVDSSNNISLTWNLNDIFASNGLEALTAGDFQVVNLAPIVTSLSVSSAAPDSTITINGQNFSGAAGNISVFFGATPSTSVNVLSDTQLTALVPAGTGTVDVTVQSGVNEIDTVSSNPNANVNAPIFGYGTSAKSSADKFTFAAFTPVSISGNIFSDLNGDGAQQAGEPGLSGWTVVLYSGPTPVQSTTTDLNGNYALTSVGPGTYILREVIQGDYLQTDPTSNTYIFTPSSGVNMTNQNFGDFLVGTVSGSTLTLNLDYSAPETIAASASDALITVAGFLFLFPTTTNIVVSSYAGGVLNFNGPLAEPFSFTGDSSAATINVNSGTLNFAPFLTVSLEALNIAAGASAVLPSATTTQSQLILAALAIASTGKLDVANNEIFIQYTTPDPIASIAAWVATGRQGLAGIISTNALAHPMKDAVGYADAADPGNPANLPAGRIEIKYTLYGDANLDGIVNGTDFAIMTAHFGQSNKYWDQGDFSGDTIVNGTDFALLEQVHTTCSGYPQCRK
jgi:hypothetical protein